MRFRCPSCQAVALVDAEALEFSCPGCGYWLSTVAPSEWDGDEGTPVHAWDHRPMVGLAIQTSGIDPSHDRVIAAATVDTGDGNALHEWTLALGAETLALEELSHTLNTYWANDRAIAVYNAQFCLSMVAAALDRHGLPPLIMGTVIDPLVIWRAAERFRPGSKTLEDAVIRFAIPRASRGNAADRAWTVAALVPSVTALTPLAGASRSDVMELQSESHGVWARSLDKWLNDGNPLGAVSEAWPMPSRRSL